MPVGSPFRTKEEVEEIEAQRPGFVWPIGEVRLDQTTGRFEYWNGTVWTHYLVEPFAKGGALLDPTAARNVVVWRAENAVTVTNVRAFQNGGSTGSTFNARKNGTDNHLAAAGTINTLDTWEDGGTVQNTSYVVGDRLEIMFVSISGSPAYITIEVDFTQP